ncbi:MAG TPA: hypothetical protein VLU41_11235, partial [Ideonella sp.]|nr:hypothetical protein [Ideonella sp.]
AFAALARAHARAALPTRGDLYWLGEGFADTLAMHEPRHGLPYLSDVARLDWCVAGAEVAADADFDAASLARLEQDDPRVLTLALRPGTSLLASRHPVAAIRAAHAVDAPATAFDAARAALAADRGETVIVWRRGWRGAVATLAGNEPRFTAALLAGDSLGAALDGAGAGFDFAAWLARALQLGWLVAARPLAAVEARR